MSFRSALAALALFAGALPSLAADMSVGYVQGPGGYYRQDDRSGPYTINSAGVASLIGTIQAGTINTTVGPTISEVTFIDKSTGAIVLRRTIIQPNGTITVVFVDLSGNTISPTLANLVPPGMAGGGTTPSPVLAALGLSTTNATVGAAYSAVISGLTSGSTVAASSSDGTVLTVSGGVVSGTFNTAGSPSISIVETLSGATGSPKTSTFALSVTTGTTPTTGLTATLVDPTFAAAVLH